MKCNPEQRNDETSLSLTASAPDILQQAIPLRKSVQGIITFAHRPNETTQCVGLALSCESTVLVNLADRDLYGSVVLGLDDAVGGAAFAWDVEVNENSLVVLHDCNFVMVAELRGCVVM